MIKETKPYIFRRIGATIIDYGLTITFFVYYLRFFGEYSVTDDGYGYSTSGFKGLPIILFWILNHVLIEYLMNATLGHWIFNLKVIDESGDKTKFKQNLKRHLVDFFEIFLYGIPAIISINNSEYHQRIGDKWAKTIVISTKGRKTSFKKLTEEEIN
ncbi:MAG: RDD family protein [Bacteroidales bacterium]|nr:RDD family protein [Bacteroidales bacterium]